MMNAFESFLKTMANIAKVRITFTHENMQGRHLAFYNTRDIPHYVSNNTPLVLDPVNPNNNRLYNPHIRSFFVETLAMKATESLVAYERARRSRSADLRIYLTLAVLWPGPFGFLNDASKFIGIPSYISYIPARLAERR